jgi:aryl-alcohol dehydrogenase-like predicted oxidoreductase
LPSPGDSGPSGNLPPPLLSAKLVLGSAQWGMAYGIANSSGPPSSGELSRMLELAFESGVRVVDTARDYGRSEERIGELVGNDPGWTVVTKLSAGVADGDPSDAELIGRIERSVELSCEALRRPTLQVLLLHRAWHRWHRSGLIWERLAAMVEEGWVGSLGVSAADPGEAESLLRSVEPKQAESLLRSVEPKQAESVRSSVEPKEAESALPCRATSSVKVPVSVVQVAYSLLDRRIVRRGIASSASRAGAVVMCRSAFLQGAALLEKEDLPVHLSPLVPCLKEIDEQAKALGLNRRQLLLAYARDTAPGPVVVGTESFGQLRSLLDDWETPPLDEKMLADLARIGGGLDEKVLDPWRWPFSG